MILSFFNKQIDRYPPAKRSISEDYTKEDYANRSMDKFSYFQKTYK